MRSCINCSNIMVILESDKFTCDRVGHALSCGYHSPEISSRYCAGQRELRQWLHFAMGCKHYDPLTDN